LEGNGKKLVALGTMVQWFPLQIDQDSFISIFDIILSCLSFAYFTHFSNLNISGTNADICKRRYLQTANGVFILSWNSM